MPTLAIVQAESAFTREGQLFVSDKSRAGLDAIAQRWPGQVQVYMTPAPGADWPPQLRPYGTSRAWGLNVVADPLTAAQESHPDVAYAPMLPALIPRLARARTPWVLSTEVDLATRYHIAADGATRIGKVRIGLGLARREPQFRECLRSARGVHINGWAAWEAYHQLNARSMQYFDSRMGAAELAHASGRVAPAPGAALRLAFSGRWMPIKGVLAAIAAFGRVRAAGIPATIDILGAGEQEPQVREQAAAVGARVLGHLDFDSEWVPYVARNVDLMVLPHTQADPSCTYLEAFGCGVPVVGYENRALLGFAHNWECAWTSPMGDIEKLAERIVDIARQPQQLARAREQALARAQEHCFEAAMAARVDHLIASIP